MNSTEQRSSEDLVLTNEEQGMLKGQFGQAAQIALESQAELGRFFGARRFVPVTHAHFTGDYAVMGSAGLAYLEQFAEAGARFVIPVSRNATCVDPHHAWDLRQASELVSGEFNVTQVLRRMGVAPLDTCVPYQNVYQPTFGERVAWGDTGAAIYANSVIGARTNFEAGPFSLFAAVTGRVPEYGYQLDRARLPTVHCLVTCPIGDVAEWGALGKLVGLAHTGYWSVPEFVMAQEMRISSDGLKHLGASLASYGSMALFHVAGITPGWDRGVPTDKGVPVAEMTVGRDEIDSCLLKPPVKEQPIRLVVFTGPQLSYAECANVAELLAGRSVSSAVKVLLTTNALVGRALRLSDLYRTLTDAGVQIIEGTCWYLMDARAMAAVFGWEQVVTNSAKMANIITASGYEPILRRTVDCVEAAVTGRLVV